MTVTTRSKAEAERIAHDLADFGCGIAKVGQEWRVTVAADERLAPILTALEKCLEDTGITSVVVDVHERTYVMEAAPKSAVASMSPST